MEQAIKEAMDELLADVDYNKTRKGGYYIMKNNTHLVSVTTILLS